MNGIFPAWLVYPSKCPVVPGGGGGLPPGQIPGGSSSGGGGGGYIEPRRYEDPPIQVRLISVDKIESINKIEVTAKLEEPDDQD
jgi:hypothetical protein